jgi:dihydroxyacetone kinase-like protein
MKKILNDPNAFVAEMLEGLLNAHPDMLSHAGDDRHCIVRDDAPVEGKVALATGGGRGCWTGVPWATCSLPRAPTRCCR